MTENKLSNSPHSILLDIWFVLIVVAIIVSLGALYINNAQEKAWKKLTSPLPLERQQMLCKDLDLSARDRKCSEDRVVYAADFYPEVKRILQPPRDNWATYDEVELLFGKYKTECREPETDSDGREYFACYYDLHDDKVFPFNAFFWSSGGMISLNFSTEPYDARINR